MLLLCCSLVASLLLVCFIFAKVTLGRCYCNVCLVGKTAIITGANSGIGLGLAKKLASRGCRVILAIRTNLELTKSKIIDETHNSNIVVRHLDLSSFSSIRKFVKEIYETESRLDILINNAGVGASGSQETEDGLDLIMQVNYYGPFLLTYLLIDLLKKSAPSRIIFNSSILNYLNTLCPKSFPGIPKNHCIPKTVSDYANTKALSIVVSKAFGQRLRGTGVTSNACHPGWVRTDIFHRTELAVGLDFSIRLLKFLTHIYGRNLDDGLHTLVHLSLSDDLKDISGKFFVDCISFFQPSLAKNQEFCDKLWKYSEKIVGLKPEEIISV